MSKQKLSAAAFAAVFFLIFVPIPTQAASRMWTPFSEPKAGLFEKIERWWNDLLGAAERPARPEPSPAWEKNGCGIDPTGQSTCPQPGPNQPAGSG